MLAKLITFFGHHRILACDGKCEKAWGMNTRARVELDPDDPDDFEWLADGELGEAPADPGTYESGHAKPLPDEPKLNKWCARECERSDMFAFDEPVKLRDFSVRIPNKREP